jgi:hypothetical protein
MRIWRIGPKGEWRLRSKGGQSVTPKFGKQLICFIRLGLYGEMVSPTTYLFHEATDDAWVIDFGGGYTEGWVNRALMETLEGDEQAVGKIPDFLKI